MVKYIIRHTKRIIIAVVGITIIFIGLALLVLPGPGLLVIIVGLIVLATEFVWAQELLEKARAQYTKAKELAKRKKEQRKTRKQIKSEL